MTQRLLTADQLDALAREGYVVPERARSPDRPAARRAEAEHAHELPEGGDGGRGERGLGGDSPAGTAARYARIAASIPSP